VSAYFCHLHCTLTQSFNSVPKPAKLAVYFSRNYTSESPCHPRSQKASRTVRCNISSFHESFNPAQLHSCPATSTRGWACEQQHCGVATTLREIHHQTLPRRRFTSAPNSTYLPFPEHTVYSQLCSQLPHLQRAAAPSIMSSRDCGLSPHH
jgi:hypothetical protein